MSGWIKLEKDLLTDPRFVAAAMTLEERYGLAAKAVPDRNVTTLPASTLLLGALARIWIIADTHIGEDDILALSAHQIDKLIGIKGLCEILPNDWLQVLDGDRVKLPDYHVHNGSTAKERSGNALRQQRYRDKHKQPTVTSRNTVTLPDKTKTRLRQEKKEEGERALRAPTARRLPEDFDLSEERKATAKVEGADAEREFAKFCDHWRAASGANARKHDWDAAWRNWCRKSLDFKPRGNGNGSAEEPKLTWRPPPDEEGADASR